VPIKLRLGASDHARRALEARLWDIGAGASTGMGCHSCVDRDVCGMLRLPKGFVDCSEFCCGSPATSTSRMCRSAAEEFAKRHIEIEGFRLENVPRAPVLQSITLPRAVPVIYHGNRRQERLQVEAAAVKLSKLYDLRGNACFATREEFLEHFRIAESAKIVVCGIDQDHFVERWWGLSKSGRAIIIENLRNLGVDLITVPNFSVSVNWPRVSDLYSIKRIALVWQEFVAAGLPAALHPNGRTDRDFERWSEFLKARPEVIHIAYDFTTGTKRRRVHHARELIKLAAAVSRPLHLAVMGGSPIWSTLAAGFASVTVLETSAFMKAMHRRRAFNHGNMGVGFEAIETPPKAPLDDLLAHDIACISSAVAHRTAPPLD
jgi:hypothetical protein